MFSGAAALSSAAVAAARARAALSRSSPSRSLGFRVARIRAPLASSVRLVELRVSEKNKEKATKNRQLSHDAYVQSSDSHCCNGCTYGSVVGLSRVTSSQSDDGGSRGKHSRQSRADLLAGVVYLVLFPSHRGLWRGGGERDEREREKERVKLKSYYKPTSATITRASCPLSHRVSSKLRQLILSGK